MMDDKSRAAVEAWLNRIMEHEPVKIVPKVEPVECEAIGRAFPALHFYGVRFPRYPRAIKPPRTLRLENVVCVRPDETLEPVVDFDSLKGFLAKNLPAVNTEERAREALLASLRLAEECKQDGHYRFTVPEGSISVVRKGERLIASGKTTVSAGGRGEVSATLRFGRDGHVKADEIQIEARIRPDVRPR
jgi:hypothetical protein